jgi:putative transposase
MPAFWLRPKRLPEGALSSISGVMGRKPDGPGAWVATWSSLRVVVSSTDDREMVGMGVSFVLVLDCKMARMVLGLERYQVERDLHFVTFSCYHRLAYLKSAASRDLFEDTLQKTSSRYNFRVIGYVVMPEHVHLLLSEPAIDLLSAGLQGLKLSVVRRAKERPFWQRRYYDFNVFTEAKRIEKLGYMHWNPVKRGLVDRPEDWRWSSCRYYQTGEVGRVSIDSSWRDPPSQG